MDKDPAHDIADLAKLDDALEAEAFTDPPAQKHSKNARDGVIGHMSALELVLHCVCHCLSCLDKLFGQVCFVCLGRLVLLGLFDCLFWGGDWSVCVAGWLVVWLLVRVVVCLV